MEAIFGRSTLAHDTLTSKEQRTEYDTYLDEQRRARSIEDLMADAMAEVSAPRRRSRREASEFPPAAPEPPPMATAPRASTR